VLDREAVPIVRLMETNSPPRSGIWQVARVLTPRSIPGEVKDQPDEWPDGRVFGHQQAELRTPGTSDCAVAERAVMSSPALFKEGSGTVDEG
jgi:hypothetical protein